MTECRYILIGEEPAGHRYRCKTCGHERTSRYPPHMLHRPCRAEAEADSARNECDRRAEVDPRCTCQIAAATREWQALGEPILPEAEQESRLAVCRACEYWDRYGARFALSLGMPTLACPLQDWPTGQTDRARPTDPPRHPT